MILTPRKATLLARHPGPLSSTFHNFFPNAPNQPPGHPRSFHASG
jgi:hypothetical protein